jgi:hypothetical protein
VPNAKAALSKQSYSPPVESMRPIMVNDVTSITRRGKRAGKDVDLDWSDYFLLIDEVGKFLGGYINISEIAEEAGNISLSGLYSTLHLKPLRISREQLNTKRRWRRRKNLMFRWLTRSRMRSTRRLF